MAYSIHLDIHLFRHSNYLNPKVHIHFSVTYNPNLPPESFNNIFKLCMRISLICLCMHLCTNDDF